MSSTTQNAGPAIGGTLHEVRAVFASDAALQDAIGRLTRSGFDRADLSLPDAHPGPGRATPEQGAQDPTTDDDNRQMRTLGTSLAGSVGAIAAAGAVIATGGAAIPAVAAAAAVGIGVGGLANAASNAGTTFKSEDRQSAAMRGELVLAVRTPDAAAQSRASAELRGAGALDVIST